MNLNQFIAAMERLAPMESALDFDNVGLLIGTERTDIRRVLVALDCTTEVAAEAVKLNCDLVLTHHPLMFNAIKRILPDHPETAAAFRLIRNDIALFAAHTNLDSAEGGVNTCLCELLDVRNAMAVGSENIMRVGDLPTEMMLEDFASLVEKKLNTVVRITGKNKSVRRVAVMGGSGGSDYQLACKHGAQVYLTGECKHSQAIEASVCGLSIIAAGHYETENVVLKPLATYLQNCTDGVEYLISEVCSPILRSL